jgi:hypothetical protein
MKYQGNKMGKYAVVALCENGKVMINRRGGYKGYDTLDEAKYVAKLHSDMGVPVCFGPMEAFLRKDGTINFTEDVKVVGSTVEF